MFCIVGVHTYETKVQVITPDNELMIAEVQVVKKCTKCNKIKIISTDICSGHR